MKKKAISCRNNKQSSRHKQERETGREVEAGLEESKERTETYHSSFWLIVRNHMTKKKEKKKKRSVSQVGENERSSPTHPAS